MTRNPKAALVVSIFLTIPLAITAFGAGIQKPKKISASANPAQYIAYSRLLTPQQKFHHALDRLTFGPRPGDLAAIQRRGLDKWVDAELHPERVPEDPELHRRLQPYDSLRMSIHDAYVHYPPPQMIAAFARGTAPLPEDPELRAIVVRLADRYVERRQTKGDQPAGVKDPNDDADLPLKAKLSSILSPAQIDVLENGKPDDKKRLLAGLPVDRRVDFVWALHREQRQKLFAVAPPELRRELMLTVNPQNVVAEDLIDAKLLRAVYSTHQLQELLVDFWYNHFNVFLNKGADRYLAPSYERDAIRPNVFGKFYDLLLATAQSPAMLFYLDNWQSAAPNLKNKKGLNENYGRELLELHTLGVDGGYTQQDVIAVARCFTGWSIAEPRKGGGFEYKDNLHDKGEKIVLGHRIAAGGGMNDGIQVLQLLAKRPATAHFISLKLAERFVSDDPPPTLVNRMADTFLRTDGDLRQVLRVMLSSPEFWSEGAYRAKVKTPFEMIVSAVRATGANVESGYILANEIQKLGEPLYRKIEPTGYSSSNAEWVSSAGLLDRMNFGLALAHNRVPGVKVDSTEWSKQAAQDPVGVARSILQEDPSEQTKTAIEKALSNDALQKQLTEQAKAGQPQRPSMIAGLVIGSPEFQRR